MVQDYVKELVINNKRGPITLSGLILDVNNDLIFTSADFATSSEVRYLFDESQSSLSYGDGFSIMLDKEMVDKLSRCRNEMMKQLKRLYKSILNGIEPLICISVPGDEVPFIITTSTILDEGVYSPKFIKALEYAFTKEGLATIGIDFDPEFEGHDDMHRQLGPIVESLDLKTFTSGDVKYHKVTLKKIIKEMMECNQKAS